MSNPLLQSIIKEVNKQKLSYEQLRYLFREVRKACAINPEVKEESLFDLPTHEELQNFYKYTPPKLKLIFKTLEGTGLRISELLNLEIKDIDFQNNTIFVRKGKGCKDRYTVFGNTLKEKLMLYLLGRKNRYLFESNRHTRYTPRCIQIFCQRFKDQATIDKKFTVHTLRHVWNTRLAEANILAEHRAILAGHSNLSSQEIYTHVGVAGIKPKLIEILDKY